MIKLLVVLIGVSAYFNVSSFVTNNQLDKKIKVLENTITQLEQQQTTDGDSCNKLHEITIVVINENIDFNNSVELCTNEVFLGDVLDEVQDDMQVVYDPNFDKDYVYGRLVHSFYGQSKEFEEYYEITIDGIRSGFGIDFVEIEDGVSYEFTLVRWS